MKLIGRLSWDTWDIAADARSSGNTDVRIEDVSIQRNELTKRHNLTTLRMRGINPKATDFLDQMKRIEEEIQNEPGLDDVETVWYRKSVRLERPYLLCYAEHPISVDQGFGLFADRYGEQIFSWDWFTPGGPGIAKKLQETGLLHFKLGMTPYGPEIIHMWFETDISLRILPFGENKSREPSWRLNIHKGSEIYWPSLVDGQIVANGFIP